MVPSRNFLNATERFIPDALRGLVAATADVRWDSEHGYLIRDSPLRPGQVAIVSGGGSGHEPLHSGFIGRGMLTAACPGLIFTSPNALQIAGGHHRGGRRWGRTGHQRLEGRTRPGQLRG